MKPDSWEMLYCEEEKRVRSFLQFDGMYISHIGSTSINGIWAKPIVDILLETPQNTPIEIIKGYLLHNVYLCMNDEKSRIYFNKGYTETGFADVVYHLHLRYWDDNDELYFRDHLKDNPAIAKQYEALKLTLWK